MDFRLSYKSFGLPVGSAPVVLVNHSLTGNADVTGENGWWSELIGDGKVIDTQQYTILAFNFPGNGADNDVMKLITTSCFVLLIFSKKPLTNWVLIAICCDWWFNWWCLGWEMGASFPNLIENLIPITRLEDHRLGFGNTLLQDRILNNSKIPCMMLVSMMMCYRTPESFKKRFGRSKHEEKGFLI